MVVRGHALLLIVITFTLGAGASGDGAPPLQKDIASFFARQEQLVGSMHCVFEQRLLLTAPENIPLIGQVSNERGDDAETSYVITPGFASHHQKMNDWWRNGSKERQSFFELESYDAVDTSRNHAIKEVAFDGRLVRTLEWDVHEIRGAIDSIKSGHWATLNRVQPFSFLYEFEVMPYSEIVGNGRNFSAERTERNGAAFTKIRVQHPSLDMRWFELTFGDEMRLVERDVIFQLSPEPEPRIYQRHVFSDYREYTGKSGEKIWFPNKAVYHYYMGNLPDGTPVEYMSEVIEIKEIEFNVEVPDEMFVIEFPPCAKVWDGINQDWISQSAEDRTLADTILETIKDDESGDNTSEPEGQETGAHINDSVMPASDTPPAQSAGGGVLEGPLWAQVGLIIGVCFLAGCCLWLLKSRKSRNH